MEPPKPTSPATEPTALCGNKSAGRIMTSVDQDCCPKNATLKSAIAISTGERDTKATSGITAALIPRAVLRAKFNERPRCKSQLENQPPVTLPTPAAA